MANPLIIVGELVWEVVKEGGKTAEAGTKSISVLAKGDDDFVNYTGGKHFESPVMKYAVRPIFQPVVVGLRTVAGVEYKVEGICSANYTGDNPDVPKGAYLPRVMVTISESYADQCTLDAKVTVLNEVVNKGDKNNVNPEIVVTVSFNYEGGAGGTAAFSNTIKIDGVSGYLSCTEVDREDMS